MYAHINIHIEYQCVEYIHIYLIVESRYIHQTCWRKPIVYRMCTCPSPTEVPRQGTPIKKTALPNWNFLRRWGAILKNMEETRLLQPRGGPFIFLGDSPPVFVKDQKKTPSTVFAVFRDHFWLHLTTLWIGERPRDKMPSQSSALIHCGQFSNPLRRIPHLTGIAKGWWPHCWWFRNPAMTSWGW